MARACLKKGAKAKLLRPIVLLFVSPSILIFSSLTFEFGSSDEIRQAPPVNQHYIFHFRRCAVGPRTYVGDNRHLFAQLVSKIERFMTAHPEERPWTCTIYSGTDGSAIFRGGVGHSLVIDLEGRLWRARSYEDFATTYRFEHGTCVIDTLTPLYAQMREYVPAQ